MKQILPIDAHLPEILTQLRQHPNIIVQASPGSGKTTRIPPALLKELGANEEIAVLVPRRLAAKLSAERVAFEMGQEVGEKVGYQFRFEKKAGASTRLMFMTEGLLARKLLSDPLLQKIKIIVLDEFHERNIHTDVAFTLIRHLQKTKRPDLKLLILSATLDAVALRQNLENCPLITVNAPPFPITIDYLAAPSEKYLEVLVKEGIQKTLKKNATGHILVFLPGVGEINRAITALQPLAKAEGLSLRPLHGQLSKEEQNLALNPVGERKIILSTNVAESSLTIEGVSCVIDSGLHRRADFSWWSGLPSLHVRPISQASAIQRAGRSGRMGPGYTLRLYPQADFNSRPSFEKPEIERADLCQLFLDFLALGLNPLSPLPWFEPPPPTALLAAKETLDFLGATDEGGITPLGREMAKLPAHPRIARLLVEASKRKVLLPLIHLASHLTHEKGLGQIPSNELFSSPREFSKRQFVSALTSHFKIREESTTVFSLAEASACLLAAFPDRVAQRTKKPPTAKQELEVLFCNGGTGLIPRTPENESSSLFVVLEVKEKKSSNQLHIQSLIPLDEEELLGVENHLLKEQQELAWDGTRKRVLQATRLMYGKIILEEILKPAPPSAEALKLMVKNLLTLDWEKRDQWDRERVVETLNGIQEDLGDFFLRLHWFQKYRPQQAPPGELLPWLIQFIEKTLGDVTDSREIQWSPSELYGAFMPALDQQAPSHFMLQNRRVKIHYSLNQEPFISSRLQDFHGLKTNPSLFSGQLSLTLHLLAPNKRPIQVTKDLKSFWEKTYPTLKNQLSRRYPRHPWP